MPSKVYNRGGSTNHSTVIDAYRFVIFPNEIRRMRKESGFTRLLAMAERLPWIPYVRLSKMERGEVFPRLEELQAIASLLGVEPATLLIDVDAVGFDIAHWASELQEEGLIDLQKDRFAVQLAAAVRALRAKDSSLTIAAIEQRFGIAPVILSRIENAFKPLDRWNGKTVSALCEMFDVPNSQALYKAVAAMDRDGLLQSYIGIIADPEIRIRKTRLRTAALREALTGTESGTEPKKTVVANEFESTLPKVFNGDAPSVPSYPKIVPARTPIDAAIMTSGESHEILPRDCTMVRLVPVFGTPLVDGLIARTPVGEWVEAPRSAGANAYGLRVCRPTLGLGLPGSATVVVDPDRFPSMGGLALVDEGNGLRLLGITFDKQGRMMGYSKSPNYELAIDSVDPKRIAMVVAAIM